MNSPIERLGIEKSAYTYKEMQSPNRPNATPNVLHELLYKTSPRLPKIQRTDTVLPIQVTIMNSKSATLKRIEDLMPSEDCANFRSKETNLKNAITTV